MSKLEGFFDFDSYVILVALSATVIFLTTYVTLIQTKKVGLKSAWKFLITSAVGVVFFSKLLGTLGYWISTHELSWGPSSVMGLHVWEVFVWRPWAKKSPVGEKLQKRWAIANPMGLAIGRMGCFFAGCCFILPGIPLNWPLLEATVLLLIGILGVTSKKPSAQTFDSYLALTLSARFILEFFRGDIIRGTWTFFSFPQVICLVLLVILSLDSQRRKYHTSQA